MFLPLKNKPTSINEYAEGIVSIPNIITEELAYELRDFALNTDISGWHRRGSKSSHVKASFWTCLIPEHKVSLYNALDTAWEKYIKEKQADLTFVEPYELKLYEKNDSFGGHNDIVFSGLENVERKINIIVQLSNETDYQGGDLLIRGTVCSKIFCTGIFFPAKFNHAVTEVLSGQRFSLIGHAWGPMCK